MSYANGDVRYRVRGISSSGFGLPWGHTLSYCNRKGDLSKGINGEHWAVNELPHLIARDAGKTLAMVRGFGAVVWFDKDDRNGAEYQPRFSSHDRLAHDSGNNEFVHTAADGRQTRFHDFTVSPAKRGLLKGFSDPAGHQGAVEYDSEDRLVAVEMTGGNSSNRYEYAYAETGDHVGRLSSVVYLADGDLVRRNIFEYYDQADGKPESRSWSSSSDEPRNGDLGDLKRVTVETRESGRWSTLEHYYFRYYTNWCPPGVPHGLKFAVGPGAYQRMTGDSIDPLTAPDWQVAQYADYYFEYDDRRRAVVEEVMGGSRRYAFERTRSGFDPRSGEYNQWVVKTVETLPDGNRNIVFTNRVGQVMLKVFESEDGTKQWCTYRRFDAKARTVLEAEPSAFQEVGGAFYDEAEADLVGYNESSGAAKFLRDTGGLLRVTEFYPDHGWPANGAPGYLKCRKLKEGTQGNEIVLRKWNYISHQISGRGTIYPVSKETCYPSADDRSAGIESATYQYTWHKDGSGNDTFRIEERMTIFPEVPIQQQGSGDPGTRVEKFDSYGYLTWERDERGMITYNEHDLATGALVKRIEDADTPLLSNVPIDWSTLPGGGSHRVTDYDHDGQGRITRELGPVQEADVDGTPTSGRRVRWTIYLDSGREQREGEGYATGSDYATYQLIDPVRIVRRDAEDRVIDEIEARRTEGSGPLSESDQFDRSGWTRWRKNAYDGAGNRIYQRVYHNVPSSGEGIAGIDYEQADYGYDVRRRRTRVKSPGGMIERIVYTVRGEVAEKWEGTDDTGATDENPAGACAPNNMALVVSNEYDEGAPGGDGNLTRERRYVDRNAYRDTFYGYDFRNRRTSVKGGIDFSEETRYDNLDRVTRIVCKGSDAKGDSPAETEIEYDSRGRVYVRRRYEPTKHKPSKVFEEKNWYDAAGNVIKRVRTGGGRFEKTWHEGAGRVVTNFVAFNLPEPDDDHKAAESVSNSDGGTVPMPSWEPQPRRQHSQPAAFNAPGRIHPCRQPLPRAGAGGDLRLLQ